jgi:UDP-N-acetylmuramoylalanine-D-glutamate ligase
MPPPRLTIQLNQLETLELEFYLLIHRYSQCKLPISRRSETHSVIMAEAAALALAAMVADRLNFNDVSFLSNCSQLVHFINDEDHNHPPDRRMKAFMQTFDNCVSNRRAKIYRISRTLNNMADALARLALSVPVNTAQSSVTVCSYLGHGHRCPLVGALNSVTLHSVRVLAASCC